MRATRLLSALGALLICGTALADEPIGYGYPPPAGSSTVWSGDSPAIPGGLTALEDRAIPPGLQVPKANFSSGCSCGSCCAETMCCPGPAGGGAYFGGEALMIRTHFSEALAFATGTVLQLQPFQASVQGRELDFDYRGSFRAYVGYNLSPATAVQFTYWRLDTNTDVNGFVAFPNQFIMDPFGHQANPGDSIFTNAEVNMSVYDLDFIRNSALEQNRLLVSYIGGVRVADVQQSYTSFIANPAAVTGVGTFNADFQGLGPHLGIQGLIRRRATSPLSLVGKGTMSLLVGQYDVTSSALFQGAGGFQFADRTRMVPVLEGELGVRLQPGPSMFIQGGWMFQSWSNIGTSGGGFGNAFVQTDDSDIMSFDGLFVRGQVNF